jgi:hypothetical protein
MITIVNRHTSQEPGLSIGRGTVFRNPSVMGTDGDRIEVVQMCKAPLRREWAAGRERKPKLLELVRRAKDGALLLVCSCQPKLCHGDGREDAVETLIAQGLRCVGVPDG